MTKIKKSDAIRSFIYCGFITASAVCHSARRGVPRTSAILLTSQIILSACSTPRIDAEWSDPFFASQTLRSAPVLVVCQAESPAIERLCIEQFVSEFKGRGLRIIGATNLPPSPDTSSQFGPYLSAAQAAGTRAVLIARLRPDATYLSPASSVDIGIGGGGRHFGTGIGISMPIASPQPKTAYACSADLIEVASKKVMWSAKAVAPGTESLQNQLAKLAQTLAESAHTAGLF